MKNVNRLYSILILAGGKSVRMGYPKPWLQYDQDTTFLRHILDQYLKSGIDEISVVLNSAFCIAPWLEEFHEIERMATVIRNPIPEKGRLYSLYLGLQDIRAEKILIHNVDNPFVESSVIEMLLLESGNEDVTIPCYQDRGGHPVVINAEVRNEIINAHEKYSSLKELLSGFSKKYVDTESNSILKNINTPVEYETSYGYL